MNMEEFKFGMTLEEVLETYKIPVPPNVSKELLREVVCVGGMNLIDALRSKNQVSIQKKIKEYFSSNLFVGDIQIISCRFARKQPGYRYWLELKYTPTPKSPKRISLILGYDTNINL